MQELEPKFESAVVLEEADTFTSAKLPGTVEFDGLDTQAVLRGWVDSVDVEAQLFILRAGGYLFEVHCDQPDVIKTLRGLKAEYVVEVTGERLHDNQAAPALRCTAIEVLNVADNPPFTPKLRADVSANVLSRYRYLEFRDPQFQKVFWMRHKLMLQISNYLDRCGCISVETPILSTPSASGSTEFCVNSSRQPELSYVLPQSSQVYGQLLVMGGVEAYYQWARCFRDEDLRSNRQPEFTQLHLEMAFVDRAKLMEIIEGMLAEACTSVGAPFELPIPRITFENAMQWYGSDKPDLRFNVEPELWPHLITESPFGADLNLISTPMPRGVLLTKDDVEALSHAASQWKFRLLGFITADRKARFAKPHLTYEEVVSSLSLETEAKPADIPVWLGRWKFVDNLRRTVYAHLLGSKTLDDQQSKYAWIIDFPLFNVDPENSARLASQNHPFTAPVDTDELLQCRKQKDLLKLKSQAFDLVVNGEEIGSGSILIHQYEVQRQIFNILGFSRQTVRQRLGYVLDAMRFGAPPMGGFGLGFDRFVAAVCGENKIRNVIAFPKTKQGYCPVTRSVG
jgi:aspartyl-tRNA synthetase